MLKTRFISSHIAGSHETRARVMPLIYYLLMAGRQSSSRIPALSMEQYCIFQQVAPIGGRVTWRASWAGGQKRVAGWEQKLKFRWQKPQQSRNYDVFCGVCGFLCGRSWCLEASVGWQRRQVKKKKGERKRRRKKKRKEDRQERECEATTISLPLPSKEPRDPIARCSNKELWLFESACLWRCSPFPRQRKMIASTASCHAALPTFIWLL